MKKDIDHVDPTWREGRDYQLVCGLNNALNFVEREHSFNVIKGNRFLPWRVAKDEIGAIPTERGDLCLFLDPQTGEWILEEFLGEWWFEKTSKNHGGYFGGKTQGKKALETGQLDGVRNPSNGGKAIFRKKVGIASFTREQLSRQASLPWWVNTQTAKTKRSNTCPGPDWVRGRKL